MPNEKNETKAMPGKEPDLGKHPRQKLDMKTLKSCLLYTSDAADE